MIEPVSRWVDIGGLKLHVREWEGRGQPFVLLHGLASNSLTWMGVGSLLAEAGHRVVAVDQRGHGLSDKPDGGYDFDTVTDDLRRLMDALDLHQPIVAGQSWGGNVVLAFGVRHSGRACGLAFVDGGFLNLGSRFSDWETTAPTFGRRRWLEPRAPRSKAGSLRGIPIGRNGVLKRRWATSELCLMGQFDLISRWNGIC